LNTKYPLLFICYTTGFTFFPLKHIIYKNKVVVLQEMSIST